MDVVVVGSLNRDISVVAERLPRPGETLVGKDVFFGPGGKGANQAVAAARLGASVAMIGRVGEDEHGSALVDRLVAEGVDVTGVSVDPIAATGLAVITIDGAAENTIVGVPGANMTLTPAHIAEQASLLSSASVVLAQLEVSIETVAAASDLTTGRLILNPAPARPLPKKLLDQVDVLVPNRSELGLLVGGAEPVTAESAAESARLLGRRGATVVTMGRQGAVVVDDDITMVSPIDVEAVDPTGAGDAFCAAIAVSLSKEGSLLDAARFAVAAGALAVTRRGAQDSMPTSDEVMGLLGR